MRCLAAGVAVLVGAAAACTQLIGAEQPIETFGSPSDASAEGSSDAGLHAFTSGSRLRARVLDGGSGAAVQTGWFDTQLGVACDFTTAHDGKLRCLPNDSSTSTFSDGACTQPVVPLYGDECPGSLPKYVQVTVSGPSCAPPSTAIYPLGSGGPQAPVALAEGLLGGMGGECAGVTPDPSTPSMVIALAPELPPSTFVAATTTSVVAYGDGKLAVRMLVADDGATRILSVVDGPSRKDCNWLDPGYVPGYANRCIAGDVGYAWPLYSDPQCSIASTAIALALYGCDAGLPPFAVVATSTGGCTSSSALASVGSLSNAPDLFSDISGQCSPEPDAGGIAPVAALAPPNPGAFQTVPSMNVGSGRLRVPSLVDPTGAPLVPSPTASATFMDTELGVGCNPMPFADGTRCVPIGTPSTFPVFADAACSQPILGWTASSCAPGPTPTAIVVSDTCQGGSAPYRVYRPGAPLSPSTTYAPYGTSCISIGASGTYFEALPADDTAWAPLTLVTE